MQRQARADDDSCALMLQEVVLVNKLWSAHQMLLFAYDDLDQAATRLRLTSPADGDEDMPGYLHREEVPGRAIESYWAAVQSGGEMQTKVSRMGFIRYEDSSRRAGVEAGQGIGQTAGGGGGVGGDKGKDCAICLMELAADLRVLPCMHYFHHECVARWLVLYPKL